MNSIQELAEKFAAAFNARDLDAMAALLAENATAEVSKSDFGVEEGRQKIKETSLPHILGDESDPKPLAAETWNEDGTTYVLLREAEGDRALDCALKLEAGQGQIQRIDYLVLYHELEELTRISQKAGMKLRSI